MIDRRRFLLALGAGASIATGVSSCSDDPDTAATGRGNKRTPRLTTTTAIPLPVPAMSGDPFRLGVASGDPDASSVVLWTRLAPAPLEGGGMPDQAAPVNWEMSRDDTFQKLVASGTAVAESRWGHSVHVTATGLKPDSWYSYRFRIGEYTSPIGRTRTTPTPDSKTGRLLLGFASCQDWEAGYYNAYRDLAATDLDLVLFLGDYIYEYGATDSGVRKHNSDEITDLVAYRNRYALYKGDSNLQAAHAHCPWVCIWDDHEVENNYASGQSEDGSITPETFAPRRLDAYQAWWEHTPIRIDPPSDQTLQIYRAVRWGNLASIFMTDERQYRTDQACDDRILDLGPACDEINSAGRTLLGDAQEKWLLDGLDASRAVWRVWGNEVVMTPITIGAAVLNYDQWDGYPADRKRILEHVDSSGMTNLIVLTGDIHLGGVGDLTTGDGETPKIVGTEFVGTSISSAGLLPPGTEEIVTSNVPAIKYVNSSQRGWTYCDVTPEKWTTEYRMVENNQIDGSPVTVDATFTVSPTTPGAVKV